MQDEHERVVAPRVERADERIGGLPRRGDGRPVAPSCAPVGEGLKAMVGVDRRPAEGQARDAGGARRVLAGRRAPAQAVRGQGVDRARPERAARRPEALDLPGPARPAPRCRGPAGRPPRRAPARPSARGASRATRPRGRPPRCRAAPADRARRSGPRRRRSRAGPAPRARPGRAAARRSPTGAGRAAGAPWRSRSAASPRLSKLSRTASRRAPLTPCRRPRRA